MEGTPTLPSFSRRERGGGGNRCLGTLASGAFRFHLGSHALPGRLLPQPSSTLLGLSSPPLGLAHSQPQSDFGQDLGEASSSCQLNRQVACLLKHISCTRGLLGVRKQTLITVPKEPPKDRCPFLRLIPNQLERRRILTGEAKVIFLLPKGPDLPQQVKPPYITHNPNLNINARK